MKKINNLFNAFLDLTLNKGRYVFICASLCFISIQPLQAVNNNAAKTIPAILPLLLDSQGPTLSVADVSILEGDTGTRQLQFNLNLSESVGISTVDYATQNGTAMSGMDYLPTSGTLTFTEGSTSEQITVLINGDTNVENDETFTLVLSNPSENLIIRDMSATGRIINDDGQSSGSTLNDTGITYGADYPSGSNVTCTSNIDVTTQDCAHGRDATHNDDSDGAAGFSFTKISANGTLLPASASSWSCVKDNVTGLFWENKTDDGTPHDVDNTYRWGGLSAQGLDHPKPQGIYYPDWNVLVNHANNNSLCGYSDWRVPTIQELTSILYVGVVGTRIDTDYFPGPTNGVYFYWSSTPAADGLGDGSAWAINFNVSDGGSSSIRSATRFLRLVR